jgi:hypothetical protein
MSLTGVLRALTLLLHATALLAWPLAAQAGDISLQLQPGFAVPLSAPSQGLDIGSAASLQAFLGLGRHLDVEIGVGFIGLPMSSAQLSSLSGLASTYGAGLRLRGPRDQRSFLGASPWVDAEALYLRAGRLEGTGFAAGAGLAFPVGGARKFWLGPFVRYLEIVRPDRTDPDHRDLRTLFAGFTFEIVLNH